MFKFEPQQKKIAKPEQVDKLGLNYSREWEMAKGMHNNHELK